MRRTFLFTIFAILCIPALLLAFGGDMGLSTQPLTNGSAAYPFLIEDLADFDAFVRNSRYWTSGFHVKLMTDIDLSGRNYIAAVIAPDTYDGNSVFDGPAFRGVFDGNGFTVFNLKIDTFGDDKCYLGLFGFVQTRSSEIKNLNMINFVITPGRWMSYVGSVAGFNYGTVKDCFAKGTIDDSSARAVGGLIGYNEGKLVNCHAEGSTSASGGSVGGLIGENSADISNCSSQGNIGGSSVYVGGLIGSHWKGVIKQCFSSAAVNGLYEVGGLIGSAYASTMQDCHASGSVTGSVRVGGLVGVAWLDADVSNCYATGSVYGRAAIGGLAGEVNAANIMNCYATGSASAYEDAAGGLIGNAICDFSSTNISSCYSTGPVIAKNYAGGLIGDSSQHASALVKVTDSYSRSSVTGINYVAGFIGFNCTGIRRCYSTGSVNGALNVGGFAGYDAYHYSYINRCFWDIETSGRGTSGQSNFGAQGKTTVQMYTKSIFGSWGFVGEPVSGNNPGPQVWFMRDGIEYPRLAALNRSPVANAGLDQTVYAYIDGYLLVQFDGTGSTDADGDLLVYSWYNDANELIARGTEPNVVFGVGEYDIKLIVNDGLEDSEPNFCKVTVIAPFETAAKMLPQTINLAAKKPVIKGRLRFAQEPQLDSSQPMLLLVGNLEIAATQQALEYSAEDGKRYLTGQFDCALIKLLPAGDTQIKLVTRFQGGQWIYGTDTIKILQK